VRNKDPIYISLHGFPNASQEVELAQPYVEVDVSMAPLLQRGLFPTF
jgi:hypothetical protein